MIEKTAKQETFAAFFQVKIKSVQKYHFSNLSICIIVYSAINSIASQKKNVYHLFCLRKKIRTVLETLTKTFQDGKPRMHRKGDTGR